jgi:hypothetical protein
MTLIWQNPRHRCFLGRGATGYAPDRRPVRKIINNNLLTPRIR